MKRLICLPLIFFALNAFAQPNQIDVIGIAPGISDKAKVYSVSTANEGSFFIIGGFRILCDSSFDDNDNKLMTFTCLTGTHSGTKFTQESNTTIHDALAIGFTKKFGKPSSMTVIPVRTGNGVHYENQVIEWKDKKGNTLALYRMLNTIDSGMFQLQSASSVKKEKEAKMAQKSREKF